MTKKKTSRRQKFYLKDMPILKAKNKPKLLQHKPSDFFKSHKKVAEALLRCLEENDAGVYLEILDAYLSINRTKITMIINLH